MNGSGYYGYWYWGADKAFIGVMSTSTHNYNYCLYLRTGLLGDSFCFQFARVKTLCVCVCVCVCVHYYTLVTDHISLKRTGLDVMQSTHCTRCISANTRPRQLCGGGGDRGWE